MNTKNISVADPIIRPRMPELDTIRGIAILSVFLFHAFDEITWHPVARPGWQNAILSLTSQGWAGVNLFFVLSGFLITGILLDGKDKPNYYSRFYSHRALRILPAYYLLLAVILGLGYVGLFDRNGLLPFLGLSFIYLANVSPMFGVPMLYWPLWSLAVEEHFYLIWPATVRRLSMRALAIVAAAICLIEPVLRLIALSSTDELWWAGMHRGGSFRYTWMSADGLAIGALLAIFARSAWGNRENLMKVARWAVLVSSCAVMLSVFVPRALGECLRDTVINYYALATVAGVLYCGTGEHRKWVNIRVLAFYGYISYGLYLIHTLSFAMYNQTTIHLAHRFFIGTDFGLTCLRLVIVLPIATGIAYLSRITYEQYFLRMKDKPAKERQRGSAAVAA